MSTKTFFRAGLLATVGTATAAMTLTANAQSRYGNINEYESSRQCAPSNCAAPMATTHSSRYGAAVAAPAPVYVPAPAYNPAPVYVDCAMTGTCAPQARTVYTQPAAPSYTQSYSAPATSYSAPATTYSAPATSNNSYSQAPANCPAGTTAQSDGTCMQSSSSSSVGSTYSSGSSYSAPSSSYATTTSAPANCPAGTTAQPDGTCMQGGSGSYTNSTVEIYSGDAQTTGPVYGYQNTGSYTSSDYLPIRK